MNHHRVGLVDPRHHLLDNICIFNSELLYFFILYLRFFRLLSGSSKFQRVSFSFLPMPFICIPLNFLDNGNSKIFSFLKLRCDVVVIDIDHHNNILLLFDDS